MIKKNLSKLLAFGGLFDLNKNSIDLRKLQINENYRIHSCYFYNKSLDVIKVASEELKIIPKLTTKVYFNFTGYPNNKHLTILDQLYKIVDKLNFVPIDWHVQICANPYYKELENEKFLIFKEKVEKNFGKIKFFIETERLWERNTSKILDNQNIDGSCFFLNSNFSGISNNDFLTKNFYIYGFLKGGLENQIKNLNMFNIFSKHENFNYAITSTSSIENFLDLKNKLLGCIKIKQENNFKINISDLKDVNYSKKCDTYGIVYYKPYNKLIYNKRRLWHEFKSSIPFLNYAKKWF